MPKLPNEIVSALKHRVMYYSASPDIEIPDADFNALIDPYESLLESLLQDMQAHPADKTFRVVEFGCGFNLWMCVLMHALADACQRNLLYLGIDIDDEKIQQVQQDVDDAFPLLPKSNSYIAADASKLDWFNNLSDKTKFNAAVFINPIVEDPFVASQDYPGFKQRMSDPEFVKRNQALRKQYHQFTAIFHKILPACLVLNGCLLVKTYYEQEYKALLKILPSIFPVAASEHNVPKDRCLAIQRSAGELVYAVNQNLTFTPHAKRTREAAPAEALSFKR